MKRLIAILALAALSAIAFAQPLKRSEIRTDSVHSAILGEDVNFNIYLPAGFDAASAQKYPVVYLLHGLYGTNVDWAERGHMKDVVDILTASGEIVKMIIITPNAGHPDARNVQNGYFNMPGRAYEDFFFKEFLPEVEKRYHAYGDKEHRAIMGLSMGGGGSTVYSQHHPELFSSCYAMSAWLDQDPAGIKNPNNKLGIVQQSVHDHSALAFIDSADDATVQALRTVKWFIDCGDDDFLLKLSMDLYLKMAEKGIKSELRVRDGWHCWEYWHQALHMALPFASRNFAPAK